jgi:curved DNA-binding protein CbpA
MTASHLPGFKNEGQLESHPLPVLLAQILERNLSGMLHIESGESKTWVWFDQGFPAGVSIPNSEVYLGMVMREMGLIDDATFNESLMVMAKTSKLRGQVLMEMGKINQEQLAQALSVQLMRKLIELFNIHKGTYRFAEGESIPGRMQPFRIHPYPVIYNGIKNCYQTEELEIILGDLLAGKACRVSEQFEERQGLLELPSDEQADIESLKEFRLPEDFVEKARSGATSAMMLLLMLHCCGMLEIGEASSAKKAVLPRPEPGPRPPQKPKVPEELEKRLKEKVKQIKAEDLQGLLEVPADAGVEQVKKAYLKLTKEFHPDRLPADTDPSIKEVTNFIFSKLSEAHQTLSDPARRKAFMKTAARQAGVAVPVDPEGALLEYEKARVFINKKDYAKAVVHLKEAHELDPKNAEYFSRFLWFGYVAAEEPKQDKLHEVRMNLEEMYRAVPGNFFVNRYLANIYRMLEEGEKYELHLAKANSIRPTDIETARELRLYNSRKEKASRRRSVFGLKKK